MTTALPTTTTHTPAILQRPLPDPVRLLANARACRTELELAKRAPALRKLRTVEEEKVNLLADHQPTGFEGLTRPDGPALGDRYSAYLRPAVAGLDALERFERAIIVAEALLGELADAFTRLDTAVGAAEREGNEILDPGRVEELLHVRRQLETARREHAGLVDDLDNARPLSRSFVEKAERVRDAAIAVVHERLVHDIRAALEGERKRVAAIRARAPEGVAPVRDLVARWAARLGQPVPLPTIKWPKGADPFSPPTLAEPEG